MKEEEWKSKRDVAEVLLHSLIDDLERIKNSGVLLGAESDYCHIVKFQIDNLLNYWNERSIVSRVRFVEGAKDE